MPKNSLTELLAWHLKYSKCWDPGTGWLSWNKIQHVGLLFDCVSFKALIWFDWHCSVATNDLVSTMILLIGTKPKFYEVPLKGLAGPFYNINKEAAIKCLINILYWGLCLLLITDWSEDRNLIVNSLKLSISSMTKCPSHIHMRNQPYLPSFSYSPNTVLGLTQVQHQSWAVPSFPSPSWHLGSPAAPPESHPRTERSTGSRSEPSRWPDVCLWSVCTSLLDTHRGNHKSVVNERVHPNDGDEIWQLILN